LEEVIEFHSLNLKCKSTNSNALKSSYALKLQRDHSAHFFSSPPSKFLLKRVNPTCLIWEQLRPLNQLREFL